MNWLHERGYRFVGPQSFYRLTLPEIRVLQAGWQAEQRVREDQQNGISSEDRQQFDEFDQQLQNDEWVPPAERAGAPDPPGK